MEWRARAKAATILYPIMYGRLAARACGYIPRFDWPPLTRYRRRAGTSYYVFRLITTCHS